MMTLLYRALTNIITCIATTHLTGVPSPPQLHKGPYMPYDDNHQETTYLATSPASVWKTLNRRFCTSVDGLLEGKEDAQRLLHVTSSIAT
jgi:hypothetical protein